MSRTTPPAPPVVPPRPRCALVLIAAALFALAACESSPAAFFDRDVGAARDIGTAPLDAAGDAARDTGAPDAPVADAASDSALDGDEALAADDGTTDAGDTNGDAADIGPPPDTGTDSGPCRGAGCRCDASTAAFTCAGLVCVDGFCCDRACGDACESCAVPGAEGTCSPHPAGSDPENECAAESPGSCGLTGMCDGERACALYDATTSCNDGESCSANDRCDGTGACRGTVPASCGPGVGNVCCLGSCADGGGCGTTPGTCADVCGGSELHVAQTCAGCGPPGAVGSCTGGTRYRCDASNHSPCQEVSCGGERYFCTNTGGTWAWRTNSGCDDGKACTFGDRCSAGVCDGAPVTCTDRPCMTVTCNGTATCTETPRPGELCDDGVACTHSDRCNASGTCEGTTVACDSSPCIERTCTGTPTCAERVRTGERCDDGALCSYGDQCTAEGRCEPTGVVDCSGADTTCSARVCDGSPACTTVAQNVGGVCDDGNPATTLDRCQADASCAGRLGCPPPADACVNGTQNRRGCGGARTVSRLAAGASGGTTISDSTCSARDDWDDSSGCWDANSDHTYRIYMWQGESLALRYETLSPCADTFSWSGTLKIFETPGCGDATCGAKVYCDYNETTQNTTYTAPRDGWVIVVADGSSAFDDEGSYRLRFTLSCRDGNCACG